MSHLFALLLLAAPAAAEESAAPDSAQYQLPPTEVTATRARRTSYDLPLAVAVVTDLHRARPGLSLDESLRSVWTGDNMNRFRAELEKKLMPACLGCCFLKAKPNLDFDAAAAATAAALIGSPESVAAPVIEK